MIIKGEGKKGKVTLLFCLLSALIIPALSTKRKKISQVSRNCTQFKLLSIRKQLVTLTAVQMILIFYPGTWSAFKTSSKFLYDNVFSSFSVLSCYFRPFYSWKSYIKKHTPDYMQEWIIRTTLWDCIT